MSRDKVVLRRHLKSTFSLRRLNEEVSGKRLESKLSYHYVNRYASGALLLHALLCGRRLLFLFFFLLNALKDATLVEIRDKFPTSTTIKQILNPNRASLFSCVCVLKLFYKTDTSSNVHYCRNSKQSNSQCLASVNTPKTCVFNKCMNLQEGVLLASPHYLG